MYSQLINEFITRESLPSTYGEDTEQWFLPLVELCGELADTIPRLPVIVGISGCQGSGKSTLAALMKSLLTARGWSVAVLSIDDFYLPGARRRRLAAGIHPLLATRGVPGTHDTELALDCIGRLRRLKEGESLPLPAFNKALDEPLPRDAWPVVGGPVDLIILEGWFLGATPQPATALQTPVNRLEADEDPKGVWRSWVNQRLGSDYQPLFRQIDLMVMLRAPGFDSVLGWRKRQEDKLRRRLGADAGSGRLMNEQQLEKFIQHYERLTRHCLETLPDKADIVFELNDVQRIRSRTDRPRDFTTGAGR